jgi:hypothetical protein
LGGPGRTRPGPTRPVIAAAIDLLPTLAKLAGVPLISKKPLDGVDLTPLLSGGPQHWPDRLIFTTYHGPVSVRSQKYRLDDKGALYDMEADPGQEKDVSREHPETAAQLAAAVAAWRKDVFGPEMRTRDDRPFTVGYREFPMTPLPARDGVPHGGVKRSGSAPNSSYFVHWKTLEDAITWDVEVNESGDYEAAIYYTCPTPDAAATVELSLNGNRVTGQVAPGWDPPLIDGQDRVPRKGESIMKEFHPLNLGSIHLEHGRGPLTLRALRIPGQSVMDVRMVTLTLKAER